MPVFVLEQKNYEAKKYKFCSLVLLINKRINMYKKIEHSGVLSLFLKKRFATLKPLL
jgi:hypothetical protein